MFETLLLLIALAVVIALNNLTISLSLGAMGIRHQVRILMVFGAFEFMMPLLGAWLGQQTSSRLVSYSEWLGPFLLGILGIITLLSAVRNTRSDREKLSQAVTSWWGLVWGWEMLSH